MMSTIISGAVGGLTAAVVKPIVFRTRTKRAKFNLQALCNGLLSGLVSNTAGCQTFEPWIAFFVGLIGGVIYAFACKLLMVMDIDDPLEASAVHGFCGMWGLMATGLFDSRRGVFMVGAVDRGLFICVQIMGLLVISLRTLVMSGIFFYVMCKLKLLRVSLIDEIIGLDISEMGSDEAPQLVIDAFNL